MMNLKSHIVDNENPINHELNNPLKDVGSEFSVSEDMDVEKDILMDIDLMRHLLIKFAI